MGNLPEMARATAERSWSSLTLFRLNAFSFGVTGFIMAMDTAVLPVIVLSLAPESLKNSYLAALGMGGLLVAAVVQPLIGRLSDRTRSPLGRRVPYIIAGTAVVCASLVLTLLAPNFAALFAAWMFIQANLNIAYGPGMALIRDLVPRARIGVASSVKILLDAVGGLVLITACAALIGQSGVSGLGPVQVYVNWEWAVSGSARCGPGYIGSDYLHHGAVPGSSPPGEAGTKRRRPRSAGARYPTGAVPSLQAPADDGHLFLSRPTACFS